MRSVKEFMFGLGGHTQHSLYNREQLIQEQVEELRNDAAAAVAARIDVIASLNAEVVAITKLQERV